MILENPSAFSAFKNIASLLPSVQNKRTHNALIKLLLDQGRTFNKTQDLIFKSTLADWEKYLHQKQIPIETLYRTDQQPMKSTDAWCFSYTPDLKIYLILERPLSAFLLHTLLGQSPTFSSTPTTLTEMEKNILRAFYTRLLHFLPQTHQQSPIQITFSPTDIPTDIPTFSFALKTKTQSFIFQLILTQPKSFQEQTLWRDRLIHHVKTLEIPLEGSLTQTLPLSDFLSLKKGDVISFSAPLNNTSIQLNTHFYPVLKGRLTILNSEKSLQVETEET